MSSTDKTPFAPGCFGSALSYSDDHVCQECPFSMDCSAKSKLAMNELRAHIGVEIKETRRGTGKMSVQAEKMFRTLGKSADEIRATVLNGHNPFSVMTPIGNVTEVLLRSPCVQRAFLTQVLMHRCKVARRTGLQYMSESTADLYVRHSLQILQHCKIIAVDGENCSVLKLQ